ncbi:MAG: InlB B-repeat-containing protein [Firmicutes bacterium]|nr:InlB B-repeat-containing protein [Bacillota bacterium]
MRFYKKTLSVIVMAVMLSALFLISGCSYYTSNLQRVGSFEIIEREDYIQIVGLTRSGARQEILIIPPFIMDKPVSMIGWEKNPFSSEPLDAGVLKSKNLKKMYIPWTIDTILPRAFDGVINFEESVNLMTSYNGRYGNSPQGKLKICLPQFIDSLPERDKRGAIPPNLICYYNYADAPNQGYYWIDLIVKDGLYIFPEPPIRAGYTFTGWFAEPECITEWGGTLPETAWAAELHLYAGWK